MANKFTDMPQEDMNHYLRVCNEQMGIHYMDILDGQIRRKVKSSYVDRFDNIKKAGKK